jgi:flagellar biosynthesis protein FlhF
MEESKTHKQLQEEIERLKVALQKATTATSNYPIVEKVKRRFIQKGIAQEWLESHFDQLIERLLFEPQQLCNEGYLIASVLESIDEALVVKSPLVEGKRMMMLVGPTGVGKSTMIAKLTAKYRYNSSQSYSVGFLNLDNFKMGAFSQLKEFAEVMGIAHLPIESHKAFMEGLSALDGEDIIFIDTTGISPYDTKRFIRIIEFMQADIKRDFEIHLVLPATLKYEDMVDMYESFSFLNLDALILSKFDETRYLGTVLNFMLSHRVPMSYFSIGQEVPDDVMEASKEYLLERFIGDLDG